MSRAELTAALAVVDGAYENEPHVAPRVVQKAQRNLMDAVRAHLAETEPTQEVTLQAREVLANVIEVQDATEGLDDGEHIIAHALAAAREQEAAEMRERCTVACRDVAMDGLPATDWGHGRKAGALECEHKLRAIPTTPDPGESK